MARKYYIIFLGVICSYTLGYCLVLEIDYQQANSSNSCLTENGPPCHSLEYIKENLGRIPHYNRNLTIAILSSRLVLQGLFSLYSISEFTLQGNGETVISCQTYGAAAGLQFFNSSNLKLLDFAMSNCTAAAVSSDERKPHSLLVWNCTNVSITNVKILHSFGDGLVLVIAGGSSDLISSCTFEHNHGAGLSIILLIDSRYSDIKIVNCHFRNNRADNGGGMHVVCESCQRNSVTVLSSHFVGNVATERGGGISVKLSGSSSYNHICFIDCRIASNRGDYGGGMALSVDYTNDHNNTLTFESCIFFHNRGEVSAAVDIQPRPLKERYASVVPVKFIDCSFHKNKAGNRAMETSSAKPWSGILFTFQVSVLFEKSIVFDDNQGTALYVSNADVIVRNANLTFTSNIGEIGGGILLLGESYIKSHGSNYFLFRNNTAFYGGALCVLSFESRFFQFIGSCFIQKDNNEQDLYEFANNTATFGIANDVFVSNLYPCQHQYNCSNVHSFFRNHSECSGNMTFSFTNNASSPYATITEYINVEPNFAVVPGREFNLNITQIDQFGSRVGELFPLSVSFKESTSIVLDSDAIINNGALHFRGRPGDSATLILQSNTVALVRVTTVVHISDCPPGFFFNDHRLTCECFEDQSHHVHCSDSGLVAGIREALWAGYLDPRKVSESFGTGVCIKDFCSFNNAVPKFQYFILPNDSIMMEQFVCADHREGILCGLCSDGYTAYYNSPNFRCDKGHLCSYGVLFYVLSEILPVTVLFFVVITFDIQLTSGLLYSFIFYAQCLDIFNIDVYDAVKFTPSVSVLIRMYKVFYGIFNLKFLFAESFSFCFRERLHVLDLFLIQYATVLYAFSLIFVTVFILKVNSLHLCIKVCHKFGRRNIRGSFVNGLAAVVVLYYIKCTYLSYNILIPADIYINGSINRTVALFNGELEYFKSDHLHYAIPALLCLFILLLPPPIILLSDAILATIEKRIKRKGRIISVLILIKMRRKLHPFLNSFQDCFRDDCKFFAGLFFVYRLSLLLVELTTSSISLIYIYAEILLFVIMSLHISFRPFKKSWHNKLDLFLIINLLVVNLISVSNYYTRSYTTTESLLKGVFDFIQISLISMPVLYVILLASWKVIKRFPILKQSLVKKCGKLFGCVKDRMVDDAKEEEEESRDLFPARLMNDSFDMSYHSFDED